MRLFRGGDRRFWASERVREVYARVLSPVLVRRAILVPACRSAAEADGLLRILLAHCPHIRGGNRSIPPSPQQNRCRVSVGEVSCLHLTLFQAVVGTKIASGAVALMTACIQTIDLDSCLQGPPSSNGTQYTNRPTLRRVLDRSLHTRAFQRRLYKISTLP